MRTIKELLQVMLDNQRYFRTGLCGWSRELHWEEIINYEEYDLLCGFIKDNNPKNTIHTLEIYYWKPREITPRIEWINKHLKQQYEIPQKNSRRISK